MLAMNFKQLLIIQDFDDRIAVLKKTTQTSFYSEHMFSRHRVHLKKHRWNVFNISGQKHLLIFPTPGDMESKI